MKRRFLFWALVIAFVWLVISRLTEIRDLLQTLAQGRWPWVLAAVLLQGLYYGLYAGLYQSAFRAVEVESRARDLLPVLLSSLFVNMVAPGGGGALFVDDAARRGQPAARAAAGVLLVLAIDFAAFSLVLAAGLSYLWLERNLKVYEIVGSGILLLIIGNLAGVLLLGLYAPDRLRGLLSRLQGASNRVAGRLRRPPLLPENWAEQNAAEFTRAAVAMAAHPGRLGRTVAVALAAHLVDLASLYALFLAFFEPVGFGALVAGFAMGLLFWIVAITPQGIGVVEGVMALVYTSLGVPAAKATVVTLAFRGLGFWLPMATGFVCLRRLRAFGPQGNRRKDE